MIARHKLIAEPGTRRLTCSVCGVCKIAKSGAGYELPGHLVDRVAERVDNGLTLVRRVIPTGEPLAPFLLALVIASDSNKVPIALTSSHGDKPFTATALKPPCLGASPDWGDWLRRAVDGLFSALKVRCAFCRASPGQWCRLGSKLYPRLHDVRLIAWVCSRPREERLLWALPSLPTGRDDLSAASRPYGQIRRRRSKFERARAPMERVRTEGGVR